MHYRKLFTSLFLSLVLVGCGTTYLDKVGSAQVTNTSVTRLIGVGASTGKLSKQDAQNLLKQVDTAQEGIVLAPTLSEVDRQDKLKMSQQILNSINDYLARKGVK